MARKIIKATFENRCVGCELCLFEAQRQLGKIGIIDSPIRILKEKSGNKIYLHVELDERVQDLNISEIQKVCPALVFEIIDRPEDEDKYIN